MKFLKIDWKEIRTLKGSQQNGFEELCSQVARFEIPPEASFVRNGTPDAGVEFYVVLPDNSEWGWQAKYFDSLGDSQWLQLDKSIKTALEKHPQLRRYFVCVPLDLPDARIGRQQSARQKWEIHVKKWKGWATKRKMDVDFVYWGSHELLILLAAPKNVGLLHFWFNVRVFDEAWFKARLNEAVKAAGPRYTPEIHVDLPIAADFEAFGRTVHFFDGIKSHARNIHDKLRNFRYTSSKNTVEVPDTHTLSLISQITSLTDHILADLSGINVQPVGELPFQKISGQVITANAVAEKLERLLYEYEREYEDKQANQKDSKEQSKYSINPFQDRRYKLMDLQRELRNLNESLENAIRLASNNLLLLTGDAGTGKTHLLCDIANRHISEGYPTILLMGQRFNSESEPWTQVLQQLDLQSLSVEEFVSTLEVAAQTAGCRALVIIDALNEGAGRLIWPSHLTAFLAHLERSPWIGVVLSLRSSYEQLIVSEDIRERAAGVKHYGFADYEYDATRTFFTYYGLELPSTPLLAPEFRNPLFLKTICLGLYKSGNRRLPRGFYGITSIFEIFFNSINRELASKLDFDNRSPLVRRALEAFANALIKVDKRWLPLDIAKDVVNALLPGRNFKNSLYYGLVLEGVLVEDVIYSQDSSPEYIVFVAYERFADHLIASSLLDAHMDTQSPKTAFVEGAPLSFLCDPQQYIASGLLEALCLQIPELTGKELIEVAPAVGDKESIGRAFRNSLIWRATSAFSNATLDCLNKMIRTEYDLRETIDVLLTIATLPEHPLNATFLDKRLRKDSMPDRDAWWSIYIHEAWNTHGAVDRLVDWASTVTQQDILDDETIDLCSTALAWMLTTSNRFLRDNATKALVSLLTGRLDAVIKFVEKFADVNDLYVTERIYAVAYGVAMFNHDSEKVGSLAKCVYSQVFATGKPPTHILLRDYARGVIERALYLGANIDINEDYIRPPYQSSWPAIPNDEDIKPFLPNWSRGSYDSGDIEWARNQIGSSVMDGDFAHYVIGTNQNFFSNNPGSRHFLSLGLDEPIWQSPDERLASLITQLSNEETEAWMVFESIDKEIEKTVSSLIIEMLAKKPRVVNANGTNSKEDIDELENEPEDSHQSRIELLKQERDAALETLKASLTVEHGLQIEEILEAKKGRKLELPRFNLRLIQHYILWRVFDLGWTIERFGYFDRFTTGYHSRDASKVERIGKKYQWIAYHEIMALVTDNFQYCDEYRNDDGDKNYYGPWQIHLRDIDPSRTLIATRKKEPWGGHSNSWWDSVKYKNWNTPPDRLEWVKHYDDLPHIEGLLSVVCPKDGSQWLNLNGFFNWKRLSSVDLDTDFEHRDLWYRCTGYLIQESDIEAFMGWAESTDFSGRMMPQTLEIYEVFLGEYGWSPAWQDFHKEYIGDQEWFFLDKDCPVKVQRVASEYNCKSSGFDCSADDEHTIILPANNIVSGLELHWSGYGSDFFDETGQIIAFDPTVHSEGPNALLLRKDKLKEFLVREKLVLCWIVTGEKLAYGAAFTPYNYAALRMSGAYVLGPKGPAGFIKYFFENRDKGNDKRSIVPLAILRTPNSEQTA